jgi:prolyl-tRNA editing enzyme YbaK/EbsC (Cys-tRNA(Pro) deacylase)
MHPSAEKVHRALLASGYQGQVLELEVSTRTAVEAAEAAGCEVGQIVKSLVFQLEVAGIETQKPVLVLVSGTNRVHEKRLGRLLGGMLVRADADTVHEISGFAIGGIPPIGHKTPIQTYIDEDLLQYSEIWAAAGTSNAVFNISPQQLVTITQGQVVCVK